MTKKVNGRGHESKARTLFKTHWKAQYKVREKFKRRIFPLSTLSFICTPGVGVPKDREAFSEIKFVGKETPCFQVIHGHLLNEKHIQAAIKRNKIGIESAKAPQGFFYGNSTNGKKEL